MSGGIKQSGSDVGLLVLRVGAGALLLFGHGLPKVLAFSERAQSFSDPLGVGSAASLALVVFAEVVCAAMVGLGLLTRLASVPVVIMMLIAAFVQHAADPFSRKELALMYLVVYLVLMLTGPGRHSLDARWRGRG